MSRPKVGDRIRLLSPIRNHPMYNIPEGTEGVVDWLTPVHQRGCQQIGVKWDTGHRLMLLPGKDRFEVLP